MSSKTLTDFYESN